MADQPPPGMTAPTPKPSSSIISPPTDNNSPESQNTQPLSPNLPPPSDSPSPTSPTDTGPSTRRYGHGRIASTSTSTSRPEGYPSWLPHRPPPPEPPSTAGVGTRPSTRAGFESPDSLGDGDFVDWEFVTPGPGDDFTPRAQRYSEEQVRMPEPEEAGPSSAQVPSQTRRHTHPGLPASSPSSPIAPKGERKPTPRSVRIVSAVGLGPALTHGQQPTSSREATDSTRVPSGSLPGYRAFSRATGASALSPTLYGSFPSTAGFGTGLKFSEGRAGKMRRSMIPTALHPSAPLPTSTMPVVPPPVRPPRFRTPKFHPTLLRDPSAWTKARWWAWGVIVVLGHVVFQTFLDFNIAYMLIQVAKHPTITPLSTRSSQRNWTLASVAYIICWALWLFGVVLIYEAVYCFWRRWRVKRPLLIPIYLSSPAYNYVCLTSYTNFCFLQHIRLSALNMYNTVIDHEAPGGIEQRPGAPGETRREVSEGKKPVRRGGDPEKTDDWEEIRKPEGDRPRISGDEETRLASASAPPVAKSSSHSNSHSDPVSYTNPSAHGTNSAHGNTSSPHGNTDSPKPGSGNGSRHSPPQQPSPKSQSDDPGSPQSEPTARHQRKISQAQTLSSKRVSDGFESAAISTSDEKPPISELASSVKSQPLSPVEGPVPAPQTEGAQATVPFRPRPRGADGSAFVENRFSSAGSVSSSSVGSERGGQDVLQFVAESCWFYSQNLPTVVLLLPRLALTLAFYIAFLGPSTGTVLGVDNGVGRDGTFFAGRGQLTTYAKVIIWFQLGWGIWRVGVLLASWIALWIFSGLGCAGLCGPRYRWEEASTAPEQEEELPLPYGGSEKRRSAALSTASHTLGQSSTHPRTEGRRTDSTAAPMPGSQRLSMYTVADSRFAERTGRRAFLDPDDHTLNWPWMERCRDRIWDVWEFCLVRSDGTRGSEADPYWLAWRTALAGGDGAGQGAAAGVSEKQAAGPSGSQAVPGVPFPSASREPGSSFSGVVPTPLSAAFSATTTAAGTPIPFLTSGSRSYMPGTPGASAAYAPLDTVLSTLPEVSSNPSLAASSVPGPTAPSAPVPPTQPIVPLPVFAAPQGPRRVPLSQELFVPPAGATATGESAEGGSGESTRMITPPEETSWLGPAAVPLAGVPISVMPAAPQQPYSFPAYSTSPSMPQGDKPILPFPLPTGTPPAEQQASSQERRSQNIFPTPATTVQSLPFPVPQQPLSPPPMSEGQPMTEYLDDEPFLTGEHGQLALHSRAASGSGTGSMSSLGQPIQTRYPFGLGRGRGRQSSASGSGSVVTSSNRDSGGSVSLAGSHQMQQSSRGSLQSGSGSGYGTHAHVRSMRSRSTRLSAISGGAYDEGGAGEVYLYPEDHDDHEEVDVGSRLSSPVEAGMAGVGAGGGVGPRPSLVGLASPTSPMSMATSQGYEIPPPPRHPQGGRRRAGTLPSPTSPTGPSVPSVPPIDTAVSRTRVASVPSAPSPVTRTYFSPISAQELDMPAFAPEYGADDDEDDADIEEDEGSQEAAEKEDSVGLLSQGPSRRSSASGLNLRSRASNISLHRRTNGSRSVSITSAGGGGVRSRAASLIQAAAPRLGSHSPPGSHSQSRESLHSAGSPVAEQTPVPRSRVDSGTASGGRAEGTTSHTSHYSDARSRTHSDNSGPHPRGPDETFGVQIDWRSDQPEAPGAFPDDPATIRPRPSRITAPAPTFEGIIPTIREPEDLASRSRPPEAQPEPGPSRTQPINIPQASRADLSSANASFVTALPSVVTESSTETAGRSSSGSDAWARGRTQRYFVEGSGFPGPR